MNDLERLERERNIRLDQEIDAFMKSLQLGCVYTCSVCCLETCDHVYLFDKDYDDAKDIYGKSMRCKFPYDQRGQLILESMLG
ncbi:histone-lysine N-methyltransferase SUVR5-like [Malus domestica]|uniref:histone-lysine N-methyltransferase SUVR5-like n=1 Tax=Malus domestica TaxID=3750 RepID=UPI0010AA4AB7|nr:histone-lysine N-methyltransferase SUVR5-like [Malus domestica]